MSDTYTIFGLSQDKPVHLYTADTAGEAKRWIQQYTRHGDFGGYHSIALYEMAPTDTVETIIHTDIPIFCLNSERD